MIVTRAVLVVQSRDVPLYPLKSHLVMVPKHMLLLILDGAFRLHNEKLTNNRRIELGDYGILQDYVRGVMILLHENIFFI
jgi:hypothetical protein